MVGQGGARGLITNTQIASDEVSSDLWASNGGSRDAQEESVEEKRIECDQKLKGEGGSIEPNPVPKLAPNGTLRIAFWVLIGHLRMHIQGCLFLSLVAVLSMRRHSG